jgi:glycosyltransferase involved in cell wall biosynthesis
VKIVIVGTAYPLRGGIAHYNALLASALSARHTVETVTFKRQYPAFLFPGKTQEETGGEIHGTPAPRLIDSINPLNWISVGLELRRRRPDLLIFKYWLPFFGPCFGTIARIVRRGTPAKVAVICDNVLPHEHRPFDALFTRFLFRKTDFFIAQSDAVERELTAFWPGARYRTVPHPVYNIFGSPLEPQQAKSLLGLPDTRILLFFGYVRRYKGLNVLLDALRLVPPDLGIHLLVVGEFYDDEQKYRAQVRDLHLDERVTIHSDYIPNEEVAKYFSAADAVVLPYVSATQSGIAQIAYNFDKPVIATDVGGLAEVVIHDRTGFVVPPGDPAALAGAIMAFYREDRGAAFTLEVKQEKKKYSWENLVNAIESLAEDRQKP